jgi:4-hydroxy-tetrahydrodipicolinate synthase
MRGVFTALVTPFFEGEVDLETHRRLCQRQLAAGIDGLVPCGTTGETPTLTDGEWGSVVSVAVEEARAAQGQPVIAGCGSNSTARTVETIAKAKALGADAALVVFPYYNKPNPTGLRAHVQAAADVGLPLMLYYVPGRTAQRLELGLLAELCNMPGVVAVKEATGDVGFGSLLLDRTDVPVLSGDDFTFPALTAMGGSGVVSVLSNVAPAMTVAWYRAAKTGDVATLRALRTQLMPIVSHLFSDTNPVPCKAAMVSMGLLKCADVRLPLAASAGTPSEAMADMLAELS